MMRRALGVLLLGLFSATPAWAQGGIVFEGETIFFASAFRTSTTASAVYQNAQHTGISLICNATSVTATPIVTFTVEVWYAPNAAWITWAAPAAAVLDAIETIRFAVNPSGTTTADSGLTSITNAPLPTGASFRLLATHSDADQMGYSCVGWPVP